MKILLITSLYLSTLITLYSQNLQWAHSFGWSSGWDRGHYITTDANNNIYITGQFEGTVDFDPGPNIYNLTSNGDFDIFISKFDADGNFHWARSIGGSFWDMGYSLAVDSLENIYVTGYFGGTVDFDPSSSTYELSSNVDPDAFILKLDAIGDFVWAINIGEAITGETVNVCGNSIVLHQNNIYLSGLFWGTTDFDPSNGNYNLTSNGKQDAFILKLDTDGNFVWAKSIGGNMYDDAFSITVDNFGNTFLTGYFNGTVDFDPGSGTYELTSGPSAAVFILKLDDEGNMVWAKNIGGSGSAVGKSITKDNFGNLYITGYFDETVDFHPGLDIFELTSNGIHDVFVLKLNDEGDFGWAKSIGGSSIEVGHSITVDFEGSVYTSGYYHDTIDFDPGPEIYELSSIHNADAFIQKMYANGEFAWANSFGGEGGDYINAITLDISGNIYSTGHFYGDADFDPGQGIYELTSSGVDDIFVFKLSNDVNLSIEEGLVWENLFYPNPTDNIININQNPKMIHSIKLYSLSGVEISNYDKSRIDIRQFPSGVYLLKVINVNGEILTEKVIKL